MLDIIKRHIRIVRLSFIKSMLLEQRELVSDGYYNVVLFCPSNADDNEINRYIEQNYIDVLKKIHPGFVKLQKQIEKHERHDEDTGMLSQYSTTEYTHIGEIEGYPIMFKRLKRHYLGAEIVECKGIHIEVTGDAYSIDNVLEYVREKLDLLIEKHALKKRKIFESPNKRNSYIAKEGFSYSNPRDDIEDTDWMKQVKHKRKSYTTDPTRSSASFMVGEQDRIKVGQLVISGRDGRVVPFHKNKDDFREQN